MRLGRRYFSKDKACNAQSLACILAMQYARGTGLQLLHLSYLLARLAKTRGYTRVYGSPCAPFSAPAWMLCNKYWAHRTLTVGPRILPGSP